MAYPKFIRERLGISQRQFADLLGISPFQYALYETGRNKKLEDAGKILKLDLDSRDFNPTSEIVPEEAFLNRELHALQKLCEKLSTEISTIRIRLNTARPRLEKMEEQCQRAESIFRTTQFLSAKGYLKDRTTLLEVDYRKQAKTFGPNSALMREYQTLEIELLQHALQHKEALATRVSLRITEIKSAQENLNQEGKKKK